MHGASVAAAGGLAIVLGALEAAPSSRKNLPTIKKDHDRQIQIDRIHQAVPLLSPTEGLGGSIHLLKVGLLGHLRDRRRQDVQASNQDQGPERPTCTDILNQMADTAIRKLLLNNFAVACNRATGGL